MDVEGESSMSEIVVSALDWRYCMLRWDDEKRELKIDQRNRIVVVSRGTLMEEERYMTLWFVVYLAKSVPRASDSQA